MIDHVYLDLYNQGSTVKNISISYEESPDVIKYITNDDIVINTFSLNESAFSGNELKFGSLVSSKMSFKIFNKRVSDALIDKELNVKEFINYDTNNPFVLGKYRVKTEKSTADKLYRQIEAYDCLYDIVNKDVSAWYESLTFPLSQKEFRDGFFSYIGIEQVQTTLANDNMVVTKTISATELPGKIVLSAICEINGAIGRINRDGKFAYVVLETNPSERITLNKIVSGSGSYEDNDTTAISKVQIRNNENDIGAIVGEDGNTYVVQDNFLVYGKSSTDLTNIANNLLSVISGISYRPFNAKFIYGNPCYEIGDALTVVTRNATFNTYLLNRTLNGIQAMSDTIKADGVEVYTENLNSTNTQFQQLKRQTNVLERTVEETVSKITSIEQVSSEAYEKAENAEITANSFESTISQQAKEIESKVSKTDYTGEEIASLINQTAENIKIIAKHISLEGTVTANNNFKINEDGSVEINSGKLNVGTAIYNENVIKILWKDSNGTVREKVEISPYNISCMDNSGKEVRIISGQIDFSDDKGANAGAKHLVINATHGMAMTEFNGKTDVPVWNISKDGDALLQSVKTTSGADLDTVKAKVDGSLKSTYFGSATGTSSAFPSVNISSIKDDTMMRIDIGIPIDNASPQTMAWFSTTVKKSTSATDYLYNVGGYYYSANYNASIFINVSGTRVTINNAWTKAIGGANAAAVNNLKSKATIYVYTENL